MWMGWVASATAQVVSGGASPDLNAQVFRPTLDEGSLLWVDEAARREHPGFAGRFLLQYVNDPLVYELEDGERLGLVTQLYEADVLGALQAGPLRVGAHVPVYLFTTGEVVGDEGGLGDIALDGKLTALQGPIDLAVNVRVSLPTHTVDSALGSSATGWELAGIVSRRFGPVLLAANVGTRGGPPAELENVSLNDGFVGRAAIGLAVSDGAGIAAEFAGTIPYSAPLSSSDGRPLELLGSGYGYTSRDVVFRGGVGTGLTPGIGSPDLRVLVGVGYEPRARPEPPVEVAGPVDTDGDGLLDPDDGCPEVAEDADGWQDEDGCPDPTTLLQVVVRDESNGEELDIGRVTVSCGETRATGASPFAGEVPPGSCEVSVTAAGYTPGQQTVDVPNGPPLEVAVVLAPIPEATVTMTRERISLRETIRFAVDEAVILPESFAMLDETARVLQEYPEIRELRIEGHSDERGPDTYNLDLSTRRARSVLDYLVSKGVDPERLSSEGFGETRPVDLGHTEAAWSKNRRTDFFVDVWQE